MALAGGVLGLAAVSFTSDAAAARKILYVHGKIDMYCYNGTVDRCYRNGDYGARYWGGMVGSTNQSTAYYVGYNGTSDPREWGSYVNGLRLSDGTYTGDGPYWNRAQSQIHAALWWGDAPNYGGAGCNNANNYCVLACHSAGCYALDYYCAHFDPSWETSAGHLNAYTIYAVASASGGSELANARTGAGGTVKELGDAMLNVYGLSDSWWAGPDNLWPMTAALETAQARSFNHDATAGRVTYHSAGINSGASGYFTDGYFGSRNDGAVSFHSACGYESQIQTNNCLDAGGTCASWSGCPWYNPFCTRYCRDFRKYTHWTNHYVLQDGKSYGAGGFDTSMYGYNKTHSQMKGVLAYVLAWFNE
jgi:hypothetical protein